jgi:predicted transcriptional regulator
MAETKEKMQEIIRQQPDDSSYEDILRELAFELMVERGLEDSRQGKLVSNEEMGGRIRTWQK